MAQTIIAKGIDVSKHQGAIDWNKVKNADIKFVMIQAGYGFSTVDPCFIRNITGAKYAGLNIGIYWFSYAHTVQDAIAEAEFCIKTIEPYRSLINMPVCFDWEYDSRDYILREYGTVATKPLVSEMAKAFLTKIENAGYYAMNYTNLDCISLYFDDSVQSRFDTWIACWSSKPPLNKYPYGIWQYGAEQNYIDSKYVDGINGVVDKDYIYTDYPAWYKNKREGNAVSTSANPVVTNPAPKQEEKKPDPPKNEVKFKAGDVVSLSNTEIFSSVNSALGIRKTGVFYIYSDEVINGKIRITNAKTHVGKTPIGMYVTGFVKTSDIKKMNSANPQPSTPVSYTKGSQITLNNAPLYSSSTARTCVKRISGTYWIYDGLDMLGRLRITNSKSNVGKTPMGSYVTGFINKTDIK